jgi:cell division transport system ATP-binding protein
MRLLIREFTPTSGEIYVEEEPLSALRKNQIPHLRRKLGVVFQDYKLLPERTIAENVSLALEIIGTAKKELQKEVSQVLELVGLNDKALMFPAQLSGGELQRVAIARALAVRPKFLFADEPTGNLDVVTGLAIGELLHTIAGYGTTVMISTHDQNLLSKLPARELHIHQGKLLEDRPYKAETADGKKKQLLKKEKDV